MPKITSVEPQKKNPKRFNVFLDGEFVFGADEDLVVDKRLVVGKEILSDELEKLLFEAEVGKLMERMYRLFDIRARSEKEIKDYLRNLSYKRKVKGADEISEEATELLISKLKQKRLLSDEEFARSWVEARSKKKGSRVLKQELYQKGIDKQIIDKLISNITNEQQIAEKLLSKKLNSWKNLPHLEVKKKAYEFLMRRGFNYETIRDIIDKFLQKGYNMNGESELE